MATEVSVHDSSANPKYKRLEDLTYEPLDVDEGDVTWRFSPPPTTAAHATSPSGFSYSDDFLNPNSEHLNALSIDELFKIEEYRSLYDEDDTDIDHSDPADTCDKYVGIGSGNATTEDIPLPPLLMTAPDSLPSILYQPGKFTVSPTSKRTVYWGDLADLWPEPPSPSLGLAPACLHAGGPPGPFVFGEPKAKAPEIEKPRVLESRKGKEKEQSESEKEARVEKEAEVSGKVWPQAEPSSNRKRKRGEHEVSSAPAPRSKRARGVMVSKRVQELRNENDGA
ncbi:hypothetical protein PENSPDRAFT_734609 [Peniophora sp. CONT]|nr:hypothetical protein PENSPDRAFT_734609 [Peniophora sp. CONT]